MYVDQRHNIITQVLGTLTRGLAVLATIIHNRLFMSVDYNEYLYLIPPGMSPPNRLVPIYRRRSTHVLIDVLAWCAVLLNIFRPFFHLPYIK